MICIDVIKARPAYFGALGIASVGVGIGAYFLAGWIKDKIDERKSGGYSEEEDRIGWVDLKDHLAEGEPVEKILAPEFRKPDLNEIVDYTKYSGDSSKNLNTTDLLKEVVMPDDENADEDLDDPRFEIITEKEYMDTDLKEVKADATYFTQEKILAGWNDDMVEKDISDTVGWKAIRMFDDPSVKSVYVRNTELKVAYEIVRCDDPFEEILQEALQTV